MSHQEEDYDVMKERIETVNFEFLDAFYIHLTEEKKISEKTASVHTYSVAFFGNDFVLNYESETLDQAIPFIDEFLGSWFIRKCMWSTPIVIKQNITSFKKFYTWMHQNKHISSEDLARLTLTIKEGKKEWIDRCTKYNDPSGEFDMEDVFPC